MKKYLHLVSFMFIISVISSCTQIPQQQLICHPVEVTECIGWLGDKPIMLEEEL